jgi:Flp pilus assembly protein TadD
MNPGMPRRFFEVADLYQEEGEEDKAREAYERAVELEPGNPRYIDGLLDMLIMMGKVKEAKENLRELKKANPDNNKIEEFEKRIKDMK